MNFKFLVMAAALSLGFAQGVQAAESFDVRVHVFGVECIEGCKFEFPVDQVFTVEFKPGSTSNSETGEVNVPVKIFSRELNVKVKFFLHGTWFGGIYLEEKGREIATARHGGRLIEDFSFMAMESSQILNSEEHQFQKLAISVTREPSSRD